MDHQNERADQALKNSRNGKAGGKIIAIIGGVIALIGIVASMIPVVIVGVVIAGLGGMLKDKTKDAARVQLNDTVVRQALDEVFENAEFNPSVHLSYEDVEGSGIPLPTHTDVGGGEYVKAAHRGMQVELSSIVLSSRAEFEDENTGMREWRETVDYQGQWMLCRMGAEMPSGLIVWPRGKLDKIFRTGTIKTGVDDFDRRFNLSADDGEAVLRYLNPARMERFLALADSAGGGLSVALNRDGTLRVGVQSGHGFFDFGKGRESADSLKERFVRELRWFIDMLDALRPACAA